MVHSWHCRDCTTSLLVYDEGEPGELPEVLEIYLRRLAERHGQTFVDTRGALEPCCPTCGSRYGFDGHFVPAFGRWEQRLTSALQCQCGMPIHVFQPALSSDHPETVERLRLEAEEAGAAFVDPRELALKRCPRCEVVWDFRLPNATQREE